MPVMSTLANVCLCRVTNVATKGICAHTPCLYFHLTSEHIQLLTIKNEPVPPSLYDNLSGLEPHLLWINYTPPVALTRKKTYTVFVFDFFQRLPKKSSFKHMYVGLQLQRLITRAAGEYNLAVKKAAMTPFVSVVHSPEEVEDPDGKMKSWAKFRVGVPISLDFSATLVDTFGSPDLDDQLSKVSLIYFDKNAVEKRSILERAPFVAPAGRCVIEDISGKKHVREDTPHPDFAPPGLSGAPVYPRVKASGEEKEKEKENFIQPLMPPPTTGVTTEPDVGPSESLTKLSLDKDADGQAVAKGEEDPCAELTV